MSTTALAEYADMLFTRAHLELVGKNWWLEMRPDTTDTDPKAVVVLRASIPYPHLEPGTEYGAVELEHVCNMHAIEENAQVSLEVITTVVGYHVTAFVESVQAAERGELLGEQST